MLRNVLAALGIVSLLSACAVPQTKLDSNAAFTPHRYSNHEIELSWRSEKTASGVRVDGEVKNVRTDTPYNSFQLTVKLLDENKKVLGKGMKTIPNRFVGTEPFSIEIPLAQSELYKRISFSYTYGTVEDFYQRDFESVP